MIENALSSPARLQLRDGGLLQHVDRAGRRCHWLVPSHSHARTPQPTYRHDAPFQRHSAWVAVQPLALPTHTTHLLNYDTLLSRSSVVVPLDGCCLVDRQAESVPGSL